jgi:two-component system, NtrC family, response regulator AtoC
MALILLVEDERLLRWSLAQRLEKSGHQVHQVDSLAAASEDLRAHQPDLVLLDLRLPDGHGLDFFQANQERLEGTAVLIMTAVGEVEDAVRAMKLGALDFLTKPVEHEALVRLVNRSLEHRSTELEAQVSRTTRERELSKDVVAQSPAFRRTLEIATDVAHSDVQTVLVQGESGTGKNLVARFIHATSKRHSRPLLEVSCAAIPEQLLESELFGHERGSFTDAKATKRGTFELADNGTVVLDEIGELKPGLQSKLLHVLEERYFRRVGGVREIHVDLCVIALTNRDLRAMTRDGSFREDLYFRVNVFPIVVPPLRQRPEDVLPLAEHYLRSFANKLGRHCEGFTREAENMLLQYPWPGNVRELRNTVERAAILERERLIGPRSLLLDTSLDLASTRVEGNVPSGVPSGIVPLEEVEEIMVHRALDATGGNQTRAAELLGISRDQLRYRVKKLR